MYERFQTLLAEANDNEELNGDQNKKALVNYIAAMFNRLANSPDQSSDRGILMLIAALNVLNTGNDPQTIGIARRLAQLSNKTPNKKI